MIKHRLSSSIRILTPGDPPGDGTPQQYQQGYFILSDEHREKSFLINDTVKYFLDKFSLPRTLTEVLAEIAREVNTDRQVIQKKCSSFFTFLCRRKIIVPDNWVEPELLKRTLFKAGDLIGNLLITETIANKKHIDIYLARDNSENNLYVIKLLNKHKLPDKERYQEEFFCLRHEYDMLRKVRHIPAMCQAYAFQDGDQPGAYILMEYIAGESLSHYLKHTENLTDTACYSLMKSILKTFSLLHESNIIHGDIHPSNIMVQEDHNIKIIDLGLSFPGDIDRMEILNFGGVIYYMPPERINISSVNKFSREPDFYSDVYQLGLILYYILYRQEPFSGFIWEELSENIKANKIVFPDLSFRNFNVPDQLKEIIKRCTIKTRKKRYPSATAVWEDFHQVMLKTKLATI